jgi:hypothetical protein
MNVHPSEAEDPPGSTISAPFDSRGCTKSKLILTLPDMFARPDQASAVSITLIRGRATGVGSEIALASDMRSQAARRPTYRTSKSARPLYRAEAQWLDYRA